MAATRTAQETIAENELLIKSREGFIMSEHENKHEVRIHVDQHKYESPNPTTARRYTCSAKSRRASNFTGK